MTRRRCCCPTNCVVYTVDFTTLDISETIPSFTEVSGSWALIEDPDDEAEVILTETGNVGAQLICDVPIPDAPPDDVNMVVNASFRCAAGIKPRQYVNWKDSSNFFYSEYDYDGGKLYLRDRNGVELSSVSVPAPEEGTEASWQTCFTRFGTLSVDFDNQRTYACVTPIPNGNKAGIGSGAAVQTYWTGFSLVRHYWSLSICPYCLCTCSGKCVGKTLTITLEDEGGCPNLDGIEIAINLYEYESDVGSMRWAYDFGNDVWICYPEEENHACKSSWTLTCGFDPDNPGDISNWRFESDETTGICDGLDFLRFPDGESTCEPLNLIFKNIPISEEPDTAHCCDEGGGSITVTITE